MHQIPIGYLIYLGVVLKQALTPTPRLILDHSILWIADFEFLPISHIPTYSIFYENGNLSL